MAVYLGTNEVTIFGGNAPPNGISPFLTLQTKDISPTESAQTIVADAGYAALRQVNLSPISSTYVGSEITRGTLANITISGKTISVSPGYYEFPMVKDIDVMTLPSIATNTAASEYILQGTIDSSLSDQYINIPIGYNESGAYYKINKMPVGSSTTPTTIDGTGANVSIGTNTITLTKSVNTVPIVNPGYISTGTASNSLINLTANITTKTAETFIPTTLDQSISSNTYLTGTQIIQGDINLISKNIKNGVSIFGVNGSYHGPEDDIIDAVQFFDYDGTVLYSYSKDQFLALNSMPANPNHTGLIAQGWNWTLADAQAYVAEWGFLDIGQMYTTSSGATEIDIHLYQGRQEPFLQLAVKGTIIIDWGDGSATTSLTGTSLTSRLVTQHIYTNPGAYTIQISISDGSWSFYSNSSTYCSILTANNSSNQSYNRVYSSTVEAIRIGNGDITINSYAFLYCSSMDYITIPNTTKITNGSAFDNCYRLRTLTYPLGNNNLSFPSCNGCYNLSFLGLSNKITGSTSGSLFSSCYNLRDIIIPPSATVRGMPTDNIATTVLRLIIPTINVKNILTPYDVTAQLAAATTISSYQFSYNPWIQEVNIPNTITSIENSVFYNTKGIKKITCAANNADLFKQNYVIYSCSALQSVTIPTAITSTGYGLFANCYSLLGPCTIPSGVTTWPNGDGFENTYSLKSLTLPNTLTSLGGYFCSYSYSLTNITLPTSLTTIGNYCFRGCYRFTNITIPNGVTSIGNYSFQYCYGLKEIHMLPTTPPTLGGTSTFNNLPTDCIIYVPSASLSAYQSATNWATYASQMVGV